MAVVARQRKNGVTYYVVFDWQGKPVWERSGSDKRAAQRLETKRKAEVRDGTYKPEAGTSRATTIAQYAAHWGAARTNKTAKGDRDRLRDHVVKREWFASLRLEDVEPSHIKRLVDELTATVKASKTVSNIYGVVRTMLRDALIDGLIQIDPCVLPRNYIKRSQKKERKPYMREDVAALLGEKVAADARAFLALSFYLGTREGETCGLRWGDWDREAEPLGCMTLSVQYGDEDLKTKTVRKVPVHPELAKLLDEWHATGFELVHCRKPTDTDCIVPMRASKMNHYGVKPHHTKSSAYKMFRRSCVAAGVTNRTLHATRHTMITFARRGGADKATLEKITHNAKGDIVDQYTHYDWLPLCEAVLAIRYLDAHQDLHRRDDSSSKTAGSRKIQATRKGANEQDSLATIPGSIPGASNQFGFENKVAPGGASIGASTPEDPETVAALRELRLAKCSAAVSSLLWDVLEISAGGEL